jgi:hypothetical protein
MKDGRIAGAAYSMRSQVELSLAYIITSSTTLGELEGTEGRLPHNSNTTKLATVRHILSHFGKCELCGYNSSILLQNGGTTADECPRISLSYTTTVLAQLHDREHEPDRGITRCTGWR